MGHGEIGQQPQLCRSSSDCVGDYQSDRCRQMSSCSPKDVTSTFCRPGRPPFLLERVLLACARGLVQATTLPTTWTFMTKALRKSGLQRSGPGQVIFASLVDISVKRTTYLATLRRRTTKHISLASGRRPRAKPEFSQALLKI